MNYKYIFVIDEVPFLERKKENQNLPKYTLENHDYHGEELNNDFYLNYFIHELIYGYDLIEIDEFLQFQFDNCTSKERFIKVLKKVVLPRYEEFLEVVNREIYRGFHGLLKTYYDLIDSPGKFTELEDGFIQSENHGIVKKCHMYDYDIGVRRLSDTKKKLIKESVLEWLNGLEDSSDLQLESNMEFTGAVTSFVELFRGLMISGNLEDDALGRSFLILKAFFKVEGKIGDAYRNVKGRKKDRALYINKISKKFRQNLNDKQVVEDLFKDFEKGTSTNSNIDNLSKLRFYGKGIEFVEVFLAVIFSGDLNGESICKSFEMLNSFFNTDFDVVKSLKLILERENKTEYLDEMANKLEEYFVGEEGLK